MDREQLKHYIFEQYGCEPDMPWTEYPNYWVFRHKDNKKWFALVMELPRAKLGISESGYIDVVNLKCNSLLIGSFRGDVGIFPAYHMNRDNWISVALDGNVDFEKITILVDMSFSLTSAKFKKSQQNMD